MEPYDVDEVIGADAYDPDGTKVGRIGQIYFDDATDEATWAAVKTGMIGTRESFVPLDGAEFDGERLTLAYPTSQIQDAPSMDAEGHLTPEEEAELYAHYGGTAPDHPAGPDPVDITCAAAGAAPPDAAVTRSEERLQVGTRSGVAGRARLRKYVVIEEEQVTVPVRREKVVLETEALDEDVRPRTTG